MKMLVVDDHAILRQGLAALLTDSGAASEVLHAASQADGLAIAGAHPDLDAVLLFPDCSSRAPTPAAPPHSAGRFHRYTAPDFPPLPAADSAAAGPWC